jgi:predicted DNA-binding transcriptional regulator YafY
MAVLARWTDSSARSGRLLSIVLLLQGRGSATAREIAEHLGVSVRTVYRDIGVLSGVGAPVYAETGCAGGYRLVNGYHTTLTGLTAQESLALFLIGLPAPAASLGLTDQARAAEAKLLAALSPAHRELASRLRDRFLFDMPAWSRKPRRRRRCPRSPARSWPASGCASATGAGTSPAWYADCSTHTGWS